MPVYYYVFLVRVIEILHGLLVVTNTVSIPLLICYQPIYIWAPIISLLGSPVLGGTYCAFNRLENVYRVKAGMPTIYDQMDKLYKLIAKLLSPSKGSIKKKEGD